MEDFLLPGAFKEINLKEIPNRIAIKDNNGRLVILKDNHFLNLYLAGRLRFDEKDDNHYVLEKRFDKRQLFYHDLERLFVEI